MELEDDSFLEEIMSSPNKTFPVNFVDEEGDVTGSENLYDGRSYIINDEVPLMIGYEGHSSMSPINEENLSDVAEEDEQAVELFLTPNGTQVFTPLVKHSLIPTIGSTFKTLEEALMMYKEYAFEGGFSVRVAQHAIKKGVLKYKYFRCNKAGIPQAKKKLTSESKLRQVTFKSCDCKAHVLIKFCEVTNSFILVKFFEVHNHKLVEPFNNDLLRVSRQLPFSTKEYIHKMGLNCVGPVKAHRLLVTLNGGHHNVKGTPDDFKNFSKKKRVYIGERDAQLVINRLQERAENMEDFYFDHEVSDGKLRSVFWVDQISKINYQAFGDVLSFDATYQTNRYHMIFVPFTGVDNHKRCVTFGAGLLFNETTESYVWLLKNFLKAHNREPRLVLSDQDSSMRAAIRQVFKTAKHRYCMWHVMKKLPVKVSGELLQNTDFRACIHRLVWSVYMKPSTFETRWAEMIVRFGLTSNDWLRDMFNVRNRWVPAYFRDVPMCCLLKTTSVSESSNAAFKINSTEANSLVEFMLAFETRLESQRYLQRNADFKTYSLSYHGDEDMRIEKHAFYVYTNVIFKEVSKEIKEGYYHCYIGNTEEVGNEIIYSVRHFAAVDGYENTFRVEYQVAEKTAKCSCRCFTRIGYLCRHIFSVFRVHHIEEIPSVYISERWRKDVLPRGVFKVDARYGIDKTPQSVLKKEIFNIVDECVELLRADSDALGVYVGKLRELKEKLPIRGEGFVAADNSGEAVVEELLGINLDVEVVVDNPNESKTKGTGRKRRYVGPAEKHCKKPTKEARQCKKCLRRGVGHDSRNCKMKRLSESEDEELDDEDATD